MNKALHTHNSISPKHTTIILKKLMLMEGLKLPSNESSSIPLIARLDHLEFIVKYLERKQRCCNNNVNANADKQSLDLAKKEPNFKGTLLDRVATLEHRLYQLCMEMDSSGSSHLLTRASTQASGESSSSQESNKGGMYYSFPTFNNIPTTHENKVMPQNHINTLELQEKSEESQHPMINSDPPKEKVVKNRAKKNGKKCKAEKKRNRPVNRPFLKLFGC